MIALARSIDPDARALRKIYEDEVRGAGRDAARRRSPRRASQCSARSVYPDATFTLRMSYGDVRGWNEKGQQVEPFTQARRACTSARRARSRSGCRSAGSTRRGKLDPNTPFNLVTNNDIVGGNSGSPLWTRRASSSACIFDGNIHSISGSYWFDERMNRAVAVHPAIIVAALRDVYGAKAIVAEILEAAAPISSPPRP